MRDEGRLLAASISLSVCARDLCEKGGLLGDKRREETSVEVATGGDDLWKGQGDVSALEGAALVSAPERLSPRNA